MSLVVERFRAGAQRLVDAAAIQENIHLVEEAEGADRFAAAAVLSMQLEHHPHRDAILKALKKRADKSYTGLKMIMLTFVSGC